MNHYVQHGSTVNLGALHLKKAFDKMNIHGLFLKLMDRGLPLQLLTVLEKWFMSCVTRVKWNCISSSFFKLEAGIRQGGVLSPYLFAVYANDIIASVKKLPFGCQYKHFSVSILMYADDIIIIAPSVVSLQMLVSACEHELASLDMAINAKKSVCMRIGPRFNFPCSAISTVDGYDLPWVDRLRYLGVCIVCARNFRCCVSDAKKVFIGPLMRSSVKLAEWHLKKLLLN